MPRLRPPGRPTIRLMSAGTTFLVVLVVIAMLAFVGLCLAGVAGHLNNIFPDVPPEAWLGVAGTLLAAVVAATIALFVLNRQLTAQQDRYLQGQADDDERDRRSREVVAAAELSANLAQTWALGDSHCQFMRQLKESGDLAFSSQADLHRLTSVWINWTEDAVWTGAGVHPRELLAAIAEAGQVVREAAGDGENVFGRYVYRDIQDAYEKYKLKRILVGHDFLSRIAHDVVVMPMWETADRAETIRGWMTISRSMPRGAPAR